MGYLKKNQANIIWGLHSFNCIYSDPDKATDTQWQFLNSLTADNIFVSPVA